MSEIITRHLRCDGCGHTFVPQELPPIHQTQAMRRQARERGWSRRVRSMLQKLEGDFCPRCTKRLPLPPSQTKVYAQRSTER